MALASIGDDVRVVAEWSDCPARPGRSGARAEVRVGRRSGNNLSWTVALTQQVDLSPDAPARAEFFVPARALPDIPGEYLLEVRLPPDELPLDDSRVMPLILRSGVPVLVVDRPAPARSGRIRRARFWPSRCAPIRKRGRPGRP